MDLAGIVGLIAAGAFAVLVAFTCVVLLKAATVLTRIADSVAEISASAGLLHCRAARHFASGCLMRSARQILNEFRLVMATDEMRLRHILLQETTQPSTTVEDEDTSVTRL